LSCGVILARSFSPGGRLAMSSPTPTPTMDAVKELSAMVPVMPTRYCVSATTSASSRMRFQ